MSPCPSQLSIYGFLLSTGFSLDHISPSGLQQPRLSLFFCTDTHKNLVQDSPVPVFKTGSLVPLVYLVQDSPVSLGLLQLVSELQQLLVCGELCPLGLVQIFAEVFDLRGVGRVPPQQLLLVEQDLLIKLSL